MNTRSVTWTLAVLLATCASAATAQLRAPSSSPPSGGGGLSIVPGTAAPASPAPPVASLQPGEPRPVDRVVAIVNADAITERELQLRTRVITDRLRQQNVRLPPEPELQRQVLERMITERAALQAARDAGIRVDDAAVDRAMARMATDAKITLPELRRRLEAEGTSFTTFRQEIAAEMTIGRLRERDIESRAQVSEAEIDALLAEQASGTARPSEYDLSQLLVQVPEGASAETVEAARERAESLATQARGGADLERLAASAGAAVSGGQLGMRPADRLPPLFVQAVELLKPGQVAPVVRSPAGFHVLKLNDRRDPGGPKLGGAPVRQTRARHILIRVNELNPEAEVNRRLTEIRQRIEGGTVTFADMARQYSADGSASQGGDLGWVYPGDTVPEFERAMDALEPGQIAGPVRTPFGFHLIQVSERRTDEASPDRVRAAARNALRERKAAEAYQEWITEVRDRAYVEIRLDER